MTIEIRAYRPGDLFPVCEVLAAALPRDPISPAKLTRQVLLDLNFRAEGALVAEQDGQVVGFCLAIARHTPLENARPDSDRGYIPLMAVRPDRQRQGLGGKLLEAAEAYLRSDGRTRVLISPYSPGYFIPGVDVDCYAGGLAFFKKHSYSELYRPIAMETSLWDWNPPAWIAEKEAALRDQGVCFEPYHAELTLPLRDFVGREFPGDWVRVARETMARILIGDSPTRLIVASQEGRILAFVHHENERFGPIGVAESERGRGLGQVLMFRALRAMREAGFRVAWFLWSDERTARRLYDSASFQVVRRFAVLQKELTGDPGGSSGV